MNKKKVITLTVLLGLTTLVALFVNQKNHQRRVIQSQKPIKVKDKWETFQKISKKKVNKRKSTKKELKETRVREDFHYVHPKHVFRHGRQLGGNGFKPYVDIDRELTIVNKVHPKWKKFLAKKLLRFMSKDVKVMVKHEKSFTYVLSPGEGKYFEQVVVNYINPDGKINSFRGMVDPGTGKLVKTWDKTHWDNFTKEKFSFSQHSD